MRVAGERRDRRRPSARARSRADRAAGSRRRWSVAAREAREQLADVLAAALADPVGADDLHRPDGRLDHRLVVDEQARCRSRRGACRTSCARLVIVVAEDREAAVGAARAAARARAASAPGVPAPSMVRKSPVSRTRSGSCATRSSITAPQAVHRLPRAEVRIGDLHDAQRPRARAARAAAAVALDRSARERRRAARSSGTRTISSTVRSDVNTDSDADDERDEVEPAERREPAVPAAAEPQGSRPAATAGERAERHAMRATDEPDEPRLHQREVRPGRGMP